MAADWYKEYNYFFKVIRLKQLRTNALIDLISMASIQLYASIYNPEE